MRHHLSRTPAPSEAEFKVKGFCIGNIEFAGLIFLHMLFGTACCGKFFVGRILAPDLFKDFQSICGCPLRAPEDACTVCFAQEVNESSKAAASASAIIFFIIRFLFTLVFVFVRVSGKTAAGNNYIVFLSGRLISTMRRRRLTRILCLVQ